MEGDDLSERMAGRFGNDAKPAEDDETAEREEREESDKSAKSEESEESEEDAEAGTRAQNPWGVDNIRESDRWTVKQLYLPEASLAEEMNSQWYAFQAATQGDFQKDRHFKPLVTALGLERLAELEDEEVYAHIEQLQADAE